jgi:hypothetical protein
LKEVVKNYIVNDYETEEISDMINSKAFDALWKEMKKKTEIVQRPPLPTCIDIFQSVQYFPSLYEIKALSEFVGVNVIVFSRSDKKNPTGLQLIDNRASNYILIHHKHEGEYKREIYSPVILGPTKIPEKEEKCAVEVSTKIKAIFTKLELKNLLEFIKIQDKPIEINIPDESA